MTTRTAYLPLESYPEALPDDSVLAAVNFAAGLGCALHVATFAVDVPQPGAPFGRALLDVAGMVRAAEEKSRAECNRLQELVRGAAAGRLDVHCTTVEVALGGGPEVAAVEARYFDLSVLPWSGERLVSQDMAQAIVFGSGRPAVMVPPSAPSAALGHIAVAWDESRVAARALGEALALLAPGGKVTVLTVQDEKPLSRAGLSATLVSALDLRGIAATGQDIPLGKGSIADALQDAAQAAGAQMLAMGGFGHSRLRDFVLGGATKGVLANLRLPTLLAH